MGLVLGLAVAAAPGDMGAWVAWVAGCRVEQRQQRLECSGFARRESRRVAGGGEAGERGGGAHLVGVRVRVRVRVRVKVRVGLGVRVGVKVGVRVRG